MDQIQERDQDYIARIYRRFPVSLVKGSGAVGYDQEGHSYIDFTSGVGVNSLGYSNRGWADVIAGQAHRLSHVSNHYYTEPQVKVAEKLCRATGFVKMIFGNSGAEANECAVKIARKYGRETHGEKCCNILTLYNSFHGRTVTMLSATGQEELHQHFFPFTEGFQYLESENMEVLEQAMDDTVCAVMIELIQGEGGVIPLSKEYAKRIEELCRKKDILLIVDEIQTGIGRTGTLFCYEQYGIAPDLVTVAKGLGGGLPIGGVLMAQHVSEVLSFGQHGSTFGGNPIVCAGALYVLETIMSNGFLDEVKEKGNDLQDALRKMPHIVAVSGLGLMVGARLEDGFHARKVAEACASKGLLVLTAKDRLRFLPPLTISREELERGLTILEQVLTSS